MQRPTVATAPSSSTQVHTTGVMTPRLLAPPCGGANRALSSLPMRQQHHHLRCCGSSRPVLACAAGQRNIHDTKQEQALASTSAGSSSSSSNSRRRTHDSIGAGCTPPATCGRPVGPNFGAEDAPAVATGAAAQAEPPVQRQGQQPWWAAVSHTMEQGLGGSVVLCSVLASTVLAGSLVGSGFGLEGPQSVAQALTVLALIVAVHETGHFMAARLQGIHVSKFAIGFGPALYSQKVQGVEFSLRTIPLGGYVAFPDPEDTTAPVKYEATDPDLLQNRPIAQRAAVISAGVVANIIFAYAVLLLQVGSIGRADPVVLPGVRVPDVVASSAAARAGVRAGDVIIALDGQRVPAAVDQVSRVVEAIKAHPQQELTLTVARGKQLLELPCMPDIASDGGGKIGVQLSPNTFIRHERPEGPIAALRMAASEFNRLGSTVVGGLSQLVTNFDKVSGSLSGPVAIVAAGSEIARTDATGLFQFAAIVNINLAVVNMLPLPALDGGYLALLAVEAARGKKLPARVEQGVMASGFLLLTALGIGLVIKDTLGLL